MADTGWVYAGTGASVARGGSYDVWETPGAITAAANKATTYGEDIGDITDWLRATNFGFAIPTGSTINGIEVRMVRNTPTYDAADQYVYLRDSTGQVGDNYEDGGWAGAVTYGASNDVWNAGLTVADINASTFGVDISGVVTDGSGICYLDVYSIEIKITYTAPASPVVTTQACTNVKNTNATANGNITDIGDSTPTRRGFCYMAGTSGDPTTANSVVYEDGSFGTGAFTKQITGLTLTSSYRVRAYAVNSAGTGYGVTVQLSTTPIAGYDELWSCDYGADKIYQHTGGTSTITTSFAGPGGAPSGLTWDGTNLWSCGYDVDTNKIYQHTGGTSTITTSFSSPGGLPSGLTWEAGPSYPDSTFTPRITWI